MHTPVARLAMVPIAALAAFCLGSSVGCAGRHTTTPSTTSEATALANDGSDSSAAENDAETMSTLFVAPSGTTLGLASNADLAGGTLTTDAFGDAVKAAYGPAGCVTATNDTTTHTATYVFDHCTGPYGLRTVTGTITVNYQSPNATTLVLDYAAKGLEVNRARFDWSAHAEIVALARGSREMTWSGHIAGTTAGGRPFSRANHKTVTWSVGGACVLVNGYSDGSVGTRDLHTAFDGYSRCKGACPASGTITLTDVDTGRSLEITFDGTSTPLFTTSDGLTARLELACL